MAKFVLFLALALASGCAAQKFPFVLPPLPYAPDATEPAIDGSTNEMHWTRQAAGAATTLNNLLNSTACASLQGLTLSELLMAVGKPETPSSCVNTIRNAGGSVWNHALYFLFNMAPYGTKTYDKHASPGLKAAIQRSFGTYANFTTVFNAAANSVFGSGWAWLVTDTKGVVSVTTTPNQNNPLNSDAPVKGLPILGIDVWEHAYWVKYRPSRGPYVGNFTSFVIDWTKVSSVFNRQRAGTFSLWESGPCLDKAGEEVVDA